MELPMWTKHLWDIDLIKNPEVKYYEIDISNVCNLDCSWCCSSYARNHNPIFMDEKIFKGLVLDAVKYNKGIELTGGGEPTLHPKFKGYLDFIIKRMGIDYIPSLGFVTNGTNMDAVRYYVENTTDPPCWIRVSLNDRDNDELLDLMKKHPKRIGISLVYGSGDEYVKCLSNLKKFERLAKFVRLRESMKFIPHPTMTPQACKGRLFVNQFEPDGTLAWCCNSRGLNGKPPEFCPKDCWAAKVDLDKIWKYNPFS